MSLWQGSNFGRASALIFEKRCLGARTRSALSPIVNVVMKSDTQHLDYLISQYVDGCLDTGSRKSLEQKLVNDPTARQLYKDQRDVQDVLDDWGNRIPMINWSEFDQKLAKKLENEVIGGGKRSKFRRFARPMSA